MAIICTAYIGARVAPDTQVERLPAVAAVQKNVTIPVEPSPTPDVPLTQIHSDTVQLHSLFESVVSESVFDTLAPTVLQLAHDETIESPTAAGTETTVNSSITELPPNLPFSDLPAENVADEQPITLPTPRNEPAIMPVEPRPIFTNRRQPEPALVPSTAGKKNTLISPTDEFPPITLPAPLETTDAIPAVENDIFDFGGLTKETTDEKTDAPWKVETGTDSNNQLPPLPTLKPRHTEKPQQAVAEVLTLPDPVLPSQTESSGTLQLPPPSKGTGANAINRTAFGKRQRDADQELLLQAARNAFRLKKNDLAISRFAEYLRLYPEDAEIRLEFAGLLSASGRAEVGAKQIEHLMTQFPDNLDVLRRYADMQMQLSRHEKAEPALERLIVDADYRIDAAVDLARVYANTNRRQAAVQLYEEILRGAAMTDIDRKLQFAELLLDIRRPAEALELLWEIHRTQPLNIRVLRSIILASARMGNHANTFEYIARLQSIEPENIKARYEFALQLFNEGYFRESILIDQQILDFEAGNADSLIRSAVANLRRYEPQTARALLQGVSTDTMKPRYLRALASYHSLVGEHADAIAICRRVLSENPMDLQTRLVLGDSYLRAGQIDRSIDIFQQVALTAQEPGVENGRQIYTDSTFSHARALAEAHQFEEAIRVLELADVPSDAEDARLDTYVAVQSKARRYGQAIQSVRAALLDSLGNHGREVHLRSTLGLLLARNGEYASAIQELSVAEQISDEPLPEAIYGKYQAYKMLGDQAGMRTAVAHDLGPLDTNSYLRVRVAELATEDCDCCFAREMLRPLDGHCEANPLVANRLGEACLMCASCEAAPNCVNYFQRALTSSPANVQAMLGIARTMSRIKNFESANLHYQKAARYMPDDLQLRREISRMLRDWQGPQAAATSYEEAMELTTTEHLVAAAQQNPEILGELEREYDHRSNLGAAVATEMTGKQLAGWKPLSAISVFEGVAAIEPHNQDAVFEIAQAYSQLNRTYCAIEQYERLLCMNPCHREAAVALDRNRSEVSPQLHLITQASSQKGRQDLSTIDHFGAGNLLQFPLGDEDEHLQVGYLRATYDPPGAPQLDGHIAIGRIQWKPIWPLLLFSQFNYEVYDYGFQPRLNFDVGAKFRHFENAEFRFHMRQENVIQNRVAIRRDIHRYGPEIGHYWRPSQRFEVDSLYRFWEYSDDNAAHEGGIHTGYQLTFGRDRLRWLTDFDWMAYREESEFLVADDLDSITKPYFAPDLFWFLSGGIEWRHYFGCDTFKAGNRRWAELYLGGRVDSDGVAYGSTRGELQYDYHNRLSASGYFEYLTSSTYTNGALGLRLTFRK